MTILTNAYAHRDYMVGIRRHLHSHPELSNHEASTSALIARELDALGIGYVRAGKHGLVATIAGTREDRMVALRADMDALPIAEENSHLDYISQVPGVMHACGHDGHVAMLLGAARILMEQKPFLKGTVKLCFQQAEEVGDGAKEILTELARHPIEAIFGIHLWSELESGLISVESGARMASVDVFEIRVRGTGTHGAYPNRGIDPIIAAAAIVLNCATIASREIDPLAPVALTFGKIAGGQGANVIPEEVVLAGTLRATSPDIRRQMMAAIERMATSTADTHRAQSDVTWKRGFGVVHNDPRCSAVARRAAESLGLGGSVSPFPTLMASENFADYLEAYPGVFAFVGIRNAEIGSHYPHHHPKFNIDESSLPIGAALHAQYAIEHFLDD